MSKALRLSILGVIAIVAVVATVMWTNRIQIGKLVMTPNGEGRVVSECIQLGTLKGGEPFMGYRVMVYDAKRNRNFICGYAAHLLK
jgi:hypothetical protein